MSLRPRDRRQTDTKRVAVLHFRNTVDGGEGALIFTVIEWDEHNLDHACRRATAEEIEQVIMNAALYREHREHRDRILLDGRTDGGRRLVVVAQHDLGRESVRPITAWEEP